MSKQNQFFLAILVVALAACGGVSRGNKGDLGPGGPDLLIDPNADMTPPTPTCLNPGPDGCPIDNCSAQARLVYVVDENNMLSSFKPDTLVFTDIGTLHCPADSGATPFSMAVDREATAWVLYSSGQVFKVDTGNAQCSATTFARNQQGFNVFGMGFSTTKVNDTEEQLFIAGGADVSLTGSMLGILDTKTYQVSYVADVSGSPELTGTSDATLWGFFPDTVAPKIAGIDKMDGTLSHVYPMNMLAGQPMAWAFAYWGGDFWVFLQTDADASTIVWHLKTNDSSVVKAIPDTGRVIVGAGVSTCAPTTIM